MFVLNSLIWLNDLLIWLIDFDRKLNFFYFTFFKLHFKLVNITVHLQKAAESIAEKIPEPNYSGLAVIDWERWRPLWDTNFGKKNLYKVESMSLVKKEGKLRNESEIEAEAKKRFESAGKRLMIETIELGKKLRPRALWGFYGFPDCHGNCTQQVSSLIKPVYA